MIPELALPRGKILVPKPKSYIKLDMAFGVGAGTSLFDKSRYRSHGAITTATWAAGLHGYCLDFVAANPDYVVIPAAHTQLNFTAEDFSIVMRVKADLLPGLSWLFARGRIANDGYYVVFDNTGVVNFYTIQGAANQITISNAALIVAGAWTTVGVSRAGASVRLYKNGVDDVAIAGGHIDPRTSARSAKIGVHDDLATFPLDGKIEFLRIFGGIALAASEHLAWHNALA